MRPLSQNTGTHPSNEPLPSFRAVPALALLIASASALGCGSAVTSSPAVQPPPATISVTVTPAGASLLLGNTQAFTPTVTGTTDTTVSWSVNGVVGGSPLTGTVNASGVYTAPLVLSTLTTVTVTAQSIADATKQASVTITILSDVTISLTPPQASALNSAQSSRFTQRSAALATQTSPFAGASLARHALPHAARSTQAATTPPRKSCPRQRRLR